MVKFRWSDNVSRAVLFSANKSNFVEKAIDALIDARRKTCERIHRSSYRAHQQYCPNLELHVGIGDHYFRLGRVIDTPFGPGTAFSPKAFFVPPISKWLTPPQRGDWPGAGPWPPPWLDDPHDDAEYIRRNADEIWARVEDTLAWGTAMEGLAREVAEELMDEGE